MVQTHYDTLGVARDASLEDIKAAFRKLSLQTHPDVAGAAANAERFKEISQAAGILTNKTKRQAYDQELARPLAGQYYGGMHHEDAWQRQRQGTRGAARRRNGPRPATNGFQQFLATVFRPRNMVLGSIAVYTTVTTARHVLGIPNNNAAATARRHNRQMVQAWKNPQSGQWEQPAPWDPLYRRLKPRLTMVPREEVKTRTR